MKWMNTGLHNRFLACVQNPFVHYLTILALGLIVYSNTFHVPFMWDDERMIVNNHFVTDMNAPGTSDKADEELIKHAKLRYVTMLTFALNYRVHGFTVLGFHAVNLTIHLINAVLIYLLVALTFQAPFLRNSMLSGARVVAFTAALLFVSHPVQTEAVTYIFQRLASLATLFYLAAVVLYAKAGLTLQNEEISMPGIALGGRRGRSSRALLYYAGALIAIIAGMFTKENTFTIPLTITIYEYFFFEGTTRWRIARLTPVWLTFGIIPLNYLIGLGKSFETATREYSFIKYDRLDYLFTQFRVLVTYLRLLIAPVHQNIDYDYPLFTSFFNMQVMASFLLLSLFFLAGVYAFLRSRIGEGGLRVVSFGIFWFFITISVESSVIPLRLLICEYRIYLPSIGLLLAAAAGLELFVLRTRQPSLRMVTRIAVLCAIAVLAAAAYARNSQWADEVLFWEDTTKESPRKFMPYYNLAVAYHDRGRDLEAIRELRIVTQLEPRYHEAYEKLGEIYFHQHAYSQAEQMFKMVIQLNPDYIRPHINLGILFDEHGQVDKAIVEMKEALRLDPHNARAHDELGVVYIRMERYHEAEVEFLAALEHNENALEPRIHLGIAYDFEGRPDDAIAELQNVLRRQPDNMDAHLRLGLGYFHAGRNDEAQQELRLVLSAEPGRADVVNTLRLIELQRSVQGK